MEGAIPSGSFFVGFVPFWGWPASSPRRSCLVTIKRQTYSKGGWIKVYKDLVILQLSRLFSIWVVQHILGLRLYSFLFSLANDDSRLSPW